MNEMRWMTGSLIALALLTGGVASAQAFQPRNGAPPEQDDLSDEAQPPAADPGPPQADDDFSDVVAADQQRGGAAAPSDRYGTQDAPAGAAPADQHSGDAIRTSPPAADLTHPDYG